MREEAQKGASSKSEIYLKRTGHQQNRIHSMQIGSYFKQEKKRKKKGVIKKTIYKREIFLYGE